MKQLYDQLKQELIQESNDQSLRLTVTLTGRQAEAFMALHAALGGPDAISRNALASRILSHALLAEQTGRRTRERADSKVVG